MAKAKKQFKTEKIELRKNLTLKVHKAGFSPVVGKRLPAGVTVLVDIAGILGKSAKKLGKMDPVLIMFNFSKREMQKLGRQIEKGME